MKPIITISLLPHEKEEKYIALQTEIATAVIMLDIGVDIEDDLFVLMPTDLMEKGLGQEIILELKVDRRMPEKTAYEIVTAVANVIVAHYPDVRIYAFITRAVEYQRRFDNDREFDSGLGQVKILDDEPDYDEYGEFFGDL